MTAPLTVYSDGQRTGIVLADTDHLATGGEASVDMKDRRIFKLYSDPQQAAARGLERKLPLLQAIRHPDVATPDGLVLDRHGRLLGLSGPYVPGDALCRLFTNTWRDAHHIGPAETAAAARQCGSAIFAVGAGRPLGQSARFRRSRRPTRSPPCVTEKLAPGCAHGPSESRSAIELETAPMLATGRAAKKNSNCAPRKLAAALMASMLKLSQC